MEIKEQQRRDKKHMAKKAAIGQGEFLAQGTAGDFDGPIGTNDNMREEYFLSLFKLWIIERRRQGNLTGNQKWQFRKQTTVQLMLQQIIT